MAGDFKLNHFLMLSRAKRGGKPAGSIVSGEKLQAEVPHTYRLPDAATAEAETNKSNRV